MTKRHRRKKPVHAQEVSWTLLRQEWLQWYAGKRAILWFFLKFGVLMILFYAVAYNAPESNSVYRAYLQVTAWLSHGLLNVFGQQTLSIGVTVQSERFSMNIKPGCDALEPAWILVAATLSYPATVRRKLVGLGIGLLMILALNFTRIVSLFFVGGYLPQFFAMLHLEIWPIVFIVVVLLYFTRWIRSNGVTA